MKKLKISMLAVLFTIGIGGAVVQKIHASPKQADPTFNWQKTDASGNVISGGQYDPGVTQAQAQSDFGCSGTITPCAVTVNHQNGTKTANPTYVRLD